MEVQERLRKPLSRLYSGLLELTGTNENQELKKTGSSPDFETPWPLDGAGYRAIERWYANTFSSLPVGSSLPSHRALFCVELQSSGCLLPMNGNAAGIGCSTSDEQYCDAFKTLGMESAD